jgi:hypothetical protein
MSRAERLIFLIDLIKRRKGLTIHEMERATGVSSRTLFRDIASLTRMNVPIYFDGGYHIAGTSVLASMCLSDADMELLRICLRFNQLSDYAFFSARCLRIERRLIKWLQMGNLPPIRCLIQPSTTNPSGHETPLARLEEQFLQAVFQRRWVSITLKSDDCETFDRIPLCLLRNRCAVLVLASEHAAEPSLIPLADVHSIALTSKAFDSHHGQFGGGRVQRVRKRV